MDLSSNPLKDFKSETIMKCFYLLLVVLQNSSFRYISKDAFKSVNLKVLQTQDYHLCCVLKDDAYCTALRPWYLSCNDLLGTTSIKVCFYVISLAVVIANVISIIAQRNGKGYFTSAFKMTVISVNVGDISIGIYMIILWISDLFYSSLFALNDIKWASSSFCFIAFAISLNFNIISPLSLCFLSLERYMVIKYPLDTNFKIVFFVMRMIIIIHTITAIFTIAMTFLMKFLYQAIPLYICSPFVDPTNSITLIKAFAWCSVVQQVISIIFILVTYILMVKELMKSQQVIQNLMSRKSSNVSQMTHLIIITGSNLLCWTPSSVIYTLSMFMDTYPVNMIIWTTLAITPINSIINPIIFTIATKSKSGNNLMVW